MKDFEILVVSFNRPEILKKLLLSFPSPMPNELVKINILTHENDNVSDKMISEFREKLTINNIKISDYPTPGASRNKLIDITTAEYLCFLDDDAQCSENYFQVAKDLMQHGYDLFGGPDQSPINQSDKQKIIGHILAHKFVMGPTYQRHNRSTIKLENADESQLTLCNMWIRKAILEENKLRFNEEVRRCEENQLLEELNSIGYNFCYDPALYVFHLRRENLSDIARIQFLSGFYRSVCFYLNRANFKSFFLIPILTGFLLTFSIFIPTQLLLLLLFLHSVMSATILLSHLITKNNLENFLWGWAVIITIHAFFSLGIFWGVLLGWKKVEKH